MNEREKHFEKIHCSKQHAIKEFKDRKFGMFIHFGLYSLLGGQYNGKKIEEGRAPHVAEWIMHALKISRTDYVKLAEDFNPAGFNGEQVAQLAKNAGMKYIIITSKHHDGFSLYDTKISDFNIMNTPYAKDLVMDLYGACKRHGLEFGLYYSQSIDWMDGGDGGICDYKNDENRTLGLHAYNDWDPNPMSFDDYIHKKAMHQVKEILCRFPDMSNIWFDVSYYIPEKYSYEFYKMVHGVQPLLLVSERLGNGYYDVACPGDNKIPENTDGNDAAWETVGTMNNSWGFKYYDNDWKSPKEILYWLVEIVSKGGNYMLNIGPDGNGNIPEENVAILAQTGEWLKENGEAIYCTRSWQKAHEGPSHLKMEGTEERQEMGFISDFDINDFWFTQKRDIVYCISLYSGRAEKIVVKSLKGLSVKSITLLGSGQALTWKQTDNSTEIILPLFFFSKIGFAVKVEMN